MSIPDRPVYPTQQQPLQKIIDDLLRQAEPEPVEGEILAVVVPNTNLLTSAPVAAGVYKLLEGRSYETVILISPSRTGTFRRINICSVDLYQTPLKDLQVNDRIRNELCDEDDDIYLDDTGHYHTEGVDVQLPFLITVLGDFDIVPVVMGEETPEFCRELGNAVGEVMYNRRTLVVASADLIEASEGALSDLKGYIELRDVSRLMYLLNSERVRLDGKGALLVALIAALHRRADHARVIDLRPPDGEYPGAVGAVIWRS